MIPIRLRREERRWDIIPMFSASLTR